MKNDIPQIQSKLIKQIVGSLNVKLNLSERKIINASHFKNFDSYNYYLKGNFEFNKRTFENYDISINYYNKALQLDPFNSKIYSLISNSFADLWLRASTTPTCLRSSRSLLRQVPKKGSGFPKLWQF